MPRRWLECTQHCNACSTPTTPIPEWSSTGVGTWCSRTERSARWVQGLPAHLLGPPLNVFRVCLHPEGLAAATRNFPEWASYLLGQLHRLVALTTDRELARLELEVRAYPNVVALDDDSLWSGWDDPALLVPLRLRTGGEELSLFTTLTTFGTPRDITLAELAVELFFPADDRTDHLLRAAGAPDGS